MLMSMEAVVAVAIGVLTAIFLASMLALVVVCSHRYCCRSTDHISKQNRQSQPDVHLVDNMEGVTEHNPDVELDEVGASFEQILQDDAWVNDATGLAPHCLAILKLCHVLTDKLVAMTMGNRGQQLKSPETISDIVSTAKRITPRVDDVVMAMYPPLDPRLLEARCSALVLSVSHLVLVCKSVCHINGVLDFVNQSLAEVEDNLNVLREASVVYESTHPLSPLPSDDACRIASAGSVHSLASHSQCSLSASQSQCSLSASQSQLPTDPSQSSQV